MFIGISIGYLKAVWIDLFILVTLKACQDLCPWGWKDGSMDKNAFWSWKGVSSVPSTHIKQLKTTWKSSFRNPVLSSEFSLYLPTSGTHIHAQTHTHKHTSNLKSKIPALSYLSIVESKGVFSYSLSFTAFWKSSFNRLKYHMPFS